MEHVTNFAHNYTVLHEPSESRTVPVLSPSAGSDREVQKALLLGLFREVELNIFFKPSPGDQLRPRKTFRLRDSAIPLSKSPVQNIVQFVQENVRKLWTANLLGVRGPVTALVQRVWA
jgi:hypothetical protein